MRAMVIIEDTPGSTENEAISTLPSVVLLSFTTTRHRTPHSEHPLRTAHVRARSRAA